MPWCSHSGAPVQGVQVQAQVRAERCACLLDPRFLVQVAQISLLASFWCLLAPRLAVCQDSGSLDREFHGRGVELTVLIHDGSGDLVSTPAMVKLIRDGSIPSGQAETSGGSAVLVVNALGEFTVSVKAPGYADTQQEISLHATGRAQIDVYLRRANGSGSSAKAPDRAILAPKAKGAFDKALEALTANDLSNAQKFAREAAQLAPAHPDVLYLQGLLFMKQRNWTEALAALEKATQIDATHAPAFAALGMTLCDQGNYAAAIVPLEKSLDLERSLQPARPVRVEKASEPEQPVRSKKSPQLSHSESAEGPRAGDTSPSLDSARAANSQPAENSASSESISAWQTRWTLAQAYYHNAQYEQALQTSQQALAASRGKAPEIALLVAQSLTAVGRYEDAAQILRQFLRDHGDGPQAATAQRWLKSLAANNKIHSN